MTIYLLTRLFAWLYLIPWPLGEEPLKVLFIISLIVSPFEIVGLAILLNVAYNSSKRRN